VELANGCLCCTVQDDFLPDDADPARFATALTGSWLKPSGPCPCLSPWSGLLLAGDPAPHPGEMVGGGGGMVDGEALALGHSVVGDPAAIERQRTADTQPLIHFKRLEDSSRRKPRSGRSGAGQSGRRPLEPSQTWRACRERIGQANPSRHPGCWPVEQGCGSHQKLLLGLSRVDLGAGSGVQRRGDVHHSDPMKLRSSRPRRMHDHSPRAACNRWAESGWRPVSIRRRPGGDLRVKIGAPGHFFASKASLQSLARSSLQIQAVGPRLELLV